MSEGILVTIWLLWTMADSVVPMRVIVLKMADWVVPCMVECFCRSVLAS